MLNKKALVIVYTLFFMAFSPYSYALTEVEQQEESFKHPVEKLTGRVGNVPVFSHIYGANFMTEQERCNYLLKLDSMETKVERDAYRAKHREEINVLRKEKGG